MEPSTFEANERTVEMTYQQACDAAKRDCVDIDSLALNEADFPAAVAGFIGSNDIWYFFAVRSVYTNPDMEYAEFISALESIVAAK